MAGVKLSTYCFYASGSGKFVIGLLRKHTGAFLTTAQHIVSNGIAFLLVAFLRFPH